MSVVAFGLRVDRAEEIAQRAWARLIEKFGRGELATIELPGLAIAQARYLARDELRRMGNEEKRQMSSATSPCSTSAIRSGATLVGGRDSP